jgi:PhnB protein
MDYPFPPAKPIPESPEPRKAEPESRAAERPQRREPTLYEDESPPVQAIPEGTHTVSPYLTVRDASRAIDFYREAFGAEELLRMPSPDGSMLFHAELEIGSSRIFLADEIPGMGSPSPQTLKATPVTLQVYVEDADALFRRALRAGAKIQTPMEDTFWGDRYGRLEDPFGHVWAIATHKEDVSPSEMSRRAAAFFASMPPPPEPAARKETLAKRRPAKKKAATRKPSARKNVTQKKLARRKTAARKTAARKPAPKRPAKKKVMLKKATAKKVGTVARKKKALPRRATPKTGHKKVTRQKKGRRR